MTSLCDCDHTHMSVLSLDRKQMAVEPMLPQVDPQLLQILEGLSNSSVLSRRSPHPLSDPSNFFPPVVSTLDGRPGLPGVRLDVEEAGKQEACLCNQEREQPPWMVGNTCASWHRASLDRQTKLSTCMVISIILPLLSSNTGNRGVINTTSLPRSLFCLPTMSVHRCPHQL